MSGGMDAPGFNEAAAALPRKSIGLGVDAATGAMLQ